MRITQEKFKEVLERMKRAIKDKPIYSDEEIQRKHNALIEHQNDLLRAQEAGEPRIREIQSSPAINPKQLEKARKIARELRELRELRESERVE